MKVSRFFAGIREFKTAERWLTWFHWSEAYEALIGWQIKLQNEIWKLKLRRKVLRRKREVWTIIALCWVMLKFCWKFWFHSFWRAHLNWRDVVESWEFRAIFHTSWGFSCKRYVLEDTLNCCSMRGTSRKFVKFSPSTPIEVYIFWRHPGLKGFADHGEGF